MEGEDGWLAVQYAYVLGLDSIRITHHRNARNGTWPVAEHPVGLAQYIKALHGGPAYDARGVATCGYIEFDFDDGHHVTPQELRDAPEVPLHPNAKGNAANSLDGLMVALAGPTLTESDRMRLIVAKSVLPRYRKLVQGFPKVSWFPWSTPRGCRILAVLSTALPPQEAATLARKIAERLDLRCETFPRGEGQYARLPLMGPGATALDRTLRFPRFIRRMDGVRALVASKPAVLADFGLSRRDLRSKAKKAVRTSNRASTTSATRVQPPPATTTVNRLDWPDCLSEQLRGAAFTEAMIRLLHSGIPDDSSRPALGKLAFLLHGQQGYPVSECEHMVEQFLERPGHRATHCQTYSGKTQLLAVFRSSLKHLDAGNLRSFPLPSGGLLDEVNRLRHEAGLTPTDPARRRRRRPLPITKPGDDRIDDPVARKLAESRRKRSAHAKHAAHCRHNAPDDDSFLTDQIQTS